jgi:hypothetical protein
VCGILYVHFSPKNIFSRICRFGMLFCPFTQFFLALLGFLNNEIINILHKNVKHHLLSRLQLIHQRSENVEISLKSKIHVIYLAFRSHQQTVHIFRLSTWCFFLLNKNTPRINFSVISSMESTFILLFKTVKRLKLEQMWSICEMSIADW